MRFILQLSRQTFTHKRTTTGMFTLGKQASCNHKFMKRVFKVLSRLRLSVTLSIHSRDFFNPSNITGANFFIDCS